MAILVVGGAGYIGSHLTRALLEKGENVVVLDNLRTGHREAVPPGARLVVADLRDQEKVARTLEGESFDMVVHFAALSLVAESMERPLDYFDNNVGGMLALLRLMERKKIRHLVFSSTAAVYGEPDEIPITEDSRLSPTNPYGESKLIMERMIRWIAQATGLSYVSLRYFNAAGAWPDGSIGEDHHPESHLVPIILQVPQGARERLSIYGRDYDTPDGSCIRDYISVRDLAEAHIRAIAHLRGGGDSLICNLGSGKGFSVLEMVQAASEVTGMPIPWEVADRRPGDPAILVASAQRARDVLGWEPTEDIRQMIASAWNWHSSHPQGFKPDA